MLSKQKQNVLIDINYNEEIVVYSLNKFKMLNKKLFDKIL